MLALLVSDQEALSGRKGGTSGMRSSTSLSGIGWDVKQSVLHSHGGGAGLLLLVPLCPPLLAGAGLSRAGVLEVGVLGAVVLGAGVLGAGVSGARVLGGGGCGGVVCGGGPVHAGEAMDLGAVELEELDGDGWLGLHRLLPASWAPA